MPQTPSLGLVGATGAAGFVNSLANSVAQWKADQAAREAMALQLRKQAATEADAKARLALSERQVSLGERQYGDRLTQAQQAADAQRQFVASLADPALSTALSGQMAGFSGIDRGDFLSPEARGREAGTEAGTSARTAAQINPPAPKPIGTLMKAVDASGKLVWATPEQILARGLTPPEDAKAAGRPLLSGDVGRISEYSTSLSDVAELKKTIATAGSTGWLPSLLEKSPNAFSDVTGIGVAAKQRKAVIDRVKQVIGKALEGGVLRKEDEYKYTKILPTLSDPNEVVLTKLDGLRDAITRRRAQFLEDLESANFDVSRFGPPPGGGQASDVPPDIEALFADRPPGDLRLRNNATGEIQVYTKLPDGQIILKGGG